MLASVPISCVSSKIEIASLHTYIINININIINNKYYTVYNIACSVSYALLLVYYLEHMCVFMVMKEQCSSLMCF